MLKLIPIFIISVVLSYMSEHNSSYKFDQWKSKVYIHKDMRFYMLLMLIMAVFVGLRTSGNDTLTYKQMYELKYAGAGAISGIEWTNLSAAPGLQFLTIILKSLNATVQDYFMFFALFTVFIYLWFIRKYTCNICFSVYLFVTMGIYTFSMAAIKQTVAIAFLLIATDRAINKKYLHFVLWVAIAELFHPFAFIYLLIPILFFKPWTKKTYLLLLGTIIVSISLSFLMEGILSMTDAIGASYSAEEFVGEGVNGFRVLVVWIPVMLSFVARRQIAKDSDRSTNLIINLTMVNAMIMFVGVFGTANYFARLANYFLMFQALCLPYLFKFFNTESRKILKVGAVISYFIFFYYQHAMGNISFDLDYNFMSIFEFFRQLF